MNDNMKLWVKDLETTDTPQARCFLNVDGGYCCLGRLCEVAIANGVPVSKAQNDGVTFYDWTDSIPSERLCAWAGITSEEASLLAFLNDAKLYSFKKIADYLRKNY